NAPTAVAGEIDGAANFASASSQYATVANYLNNPSSLTVSFWIKNSQSAGNIFVAKQNNNASGAGWYIGQNLVNSGNIYTELQTNGSNWAQWRTAASNTNNGSWHHIAGTITNGGGSSAAWAVWIDGVSKTLTKTGAGTLGSTSNSESVRFATDG